jgi:DNA-binding SARP family transcriptional activator
MVDIGGIHVAGSEIRRKVLALLCFLLTRPRWAATREEVMEAMWPEMDPAAAVNSLNQSVYFLRRVFEPEYSEETTAGYVHQDSDILWLDAELVQAVSARCASLIADYERAADPATAVRLAEEYVGRFALDFAYEDWSASFREWLHVAYLHVVETQVRADVDRGQFQRGLSIARRAVEVEPRSDELELSLVRLLRGSGAHSAAAEQFTRYANVLRTDLGVEPPPIDAV